MPLQVHDVEIVDGSTQAYNDRVVMGIMASAVNNGSPGEIGSVAVNVAGQYDSLPVVSVSGNGSGAVLVPHMKVVAATVAAAGSGYVPADTITTTGGTGTKAVMTIDTTKLVSVAVNAAGTGYAAGDSITLAGGVFTTAAVLSVASTKLISAAVSAAGSGYAINDTITLAGGTHSSAAVLTVTHAKLVSVALNAAGSGYAPGDTITLSGGTAGTKAVITVDTVATGAIATFHISTAGDYTVEASSFTQDSTSGSGTGATFNTALFGVLTVTVSGGSYTVNSSSFTQASTSGSGTGATFNTAVWGVNAITISNAGIYQTNSASFTQSATSGSGSGATFQTASYGVNTFHISTAGDYTVLPSEPVAQGSTSGSGTGATFNFGSAHGYGLLSITVSAGGDGYDNGSAVVLTGGQYVAAQTTITLTNYTGDAVTVPVSFSDSANLPENYCVFVNPQQASVFWSVANSSKTSSGFDVVLTPLAGGSVVAGHIDVLVVG